MSLGKTLVKARKQAGLTQEKLAEKAGISRGLLSLLEIDRRTVPTESVQALADALELKGDERAEFVRLAHLTHSTDDLRQMLDESRAQVRFLAELVGLGVPVTVNADEAKKYGKEAAEKLAAARRANQQLYERLMEASGKKKPPKITGAEADEIPDSPLAPPAEPFARRLPKRGKSK
jgi:transcriptional regulator with XRE-family HTH domain